MKKSHYVENVLKSAHIQGNIPENETWNQVEEIQKGWSSDEKFKISASSGETYLLRLSAIDNDEEKKKEFSMLEKFNALGIPMSHPICFGTCQQEQLVYMILSWVEGVDLEDVLPSFSQEKQYQLGREAGGILRNMHQIPVVKEELPLETKRAKKLLQLSRYEESDVRIPHDETAVQYVKEHMDQIWKEKPVYLHGDFHPGNLIYQPDGTIGVIDFNRWEVGDPYEEFNKLESFARELSVPYCRGQIQAYFQDQVPTEFWETLAVYVAHASLYSIKWAEKFGQEEIEGMVSRCQQAFADYEGFTRTIPVWY